MGICLCCCFGRRNYRRMDPNLGTATTDHIVITDDGSVVHRTAAASSSSSTSEASSLLPKSSKSNKTNRSKTQEQSHKSATSNSIFIEPNNNSNSGEIFVRNTPGGASSYYDRPDQITAAAVATTSSSSTTTTTTTTTTVTSSSVPNSSSTISKHLHQLSATPLAASDPHRSDSSSTAESTTTAAAAAAAAASTTISNSGGVMTLRLDVSNDDANANADADATTLPTIQAIVNENTTLVYTLRSGNTVIQDIPVRMGRKNELLLRRIANATTTTAAAAPTADHTAVSDVVEDEVTWVLSDAPGRTITVREDLTLGEEDAGEHKEMSLSEGTRVLSVINKNDVSVMVRLFHDTEEILSELLHAQTDAKLTQGDGVLPRGRPGKRFKNHQFYLSIQPMRSDTATTALGLPCVYNLPDSDCDVKVRIQWSQEEGVISLLPIKKGKKSNKSLRENVTKDQLVQGKLPSPQ